MPSEASRSVRPAESVMALNGQQELDVQLSIFQGRAVKGSSYPGFLSAMLITTFIARSFAAFAKVS